MTTLTISYRAAPHTVCSLDQAALLHRRYRVRWRYLFEPNRRRRVPEMATRLSAGMAVSLEATLTERVSHSRLSKLFSASLLIFVGLLSSLQLALGQFTQQGSKLLGTGTVGLASQGWSVALSGDGNTAIMGGRDDHSSTGAAWVFTRNNADVWSQQGSKLVGTDAVGKAGQGMSVALSSDGNTAIVGAATIRTPQLVRGARSLTIVRDQGVPVIRL